MGRLRLASAALGAGARGFSALAFRRCTDTTRLSTRAHSFALASSSYAGGPLLAAVRGFASYPSHTLLSMPALSPTMEEGGLVSWSVEVGQEVSPGDALAEVETDKATLTWENQDDGVVAKLLVPAGTSGIKVGTPVAVLADDEGDVVAFADFTAEAGTGAGGETGGDATAPPTAAPTAPAAADRALGHLLGPAARLVLEAAGLTRDDVQPTFPGGIVTKADALKAVRDGIKHHASPVAKAEEAAPAPPPARDAVASAAPATPAAEAVAPAPSAPRAVKRARRSDPAPYEEVPLTQMRKIIAKRLTESKQTVPHLYLSADVRTEAVDELRASLKRFGRRASVNDAVIKAVAVALRKVPAANSHWDDEAGLIVPFPDVDVSVAVATPKGLLTPIVRGADAKPLEAIGAEVRELAGRARAGKLKPEEFTGGSFSISNLGMFGIDKFFAIINPPQGAIMAVSAARSEAEAVGLAAASAGDATEPVPVELQAARVMTITLSADARVFDGKVSHEFLQAFKEAFENPIALV